MFFLNTNFNILVKSRSCMQAVQALWDMYGLYLAPCKVMSCKPCTLQSCAFLASTFLTRLSPRKPKRHVIGGEVYFTLPSPPEITFHYLIIFTNSRYWRLREKNNIIKLNFHCFFLTPTVTQGVGDP